MAHTERTGLILFTAALAGLPIVMLATRLIAG